MTTYTFSDELISDFHKDARGFRPRGLFMDIWNAATDAEKQRIWDCLEEDFREREEQEAAAETAALNDFFQQLVLNKSLGATSTAEAVRWMIQADREYPIENSQDVEHFVYNLGILFTDTGRQLVKDICKEYGFWYRGDN